MAATESSGDYITFSTVGSRGFTVYMRLRVTSYAAYGDPLTIEEAGDEAAFEYDATTLYFYEQAGGPHNILTGTDTTSWVDVAIVINGTAATAYSKAPTANSWTTLATWTSATTANVVVGSWPTYGASLGTHLISGLKMWDAALNTMELLYESRFLTPYRSLNLRFSNPMTVGERAHINAPGGRNGVVTGGMISNATAQSGLTWSRTRMLPRVSDTGAAAAATSDALPSAGQRLLQSSGLYRMSGCDDVLAPEHRELFAPETKIHVVPALPASMQRRPRALAQHTGR